MVNCCPAGRQSWQGLRAQAAPRPGPSQGEGRLEQGDAARGPQCLRPRAVRKDRLTQLTAGSFVPQVADA